jgi:hypothetical protein
MGLIRKPRSDDLVKPFPDKRWDFYRSDRQVNEGDLADPGGGSGNSNFPFPTSPIIGYVFAQGDGSNPAYLQLFNPGASLVDVAIYEMYVWFAAHATGDVVYGKRTDSPVTLVSPNVANLQRMVENDVTPIRSKLYGGANGGSIITSTDANFYIPPRVEGDTGFDPYPIRMPMQFPIILRPGQAFEVSADTNSTGTKMRMQVVVDETGAAA